jgi:hypothetical protein
VSPPSLTTAMRSREVTMWTFRPNTPIISRLHSAAPCRGRDARSRRLRRATGMSGRGRPDSAMGRFARPGCGPPASRRAPTLVAIGSSDPRAPTIAGADAASRVLRALVAEWSMTPSPIGEAAARYVRTAP